MHFKFSTKKKIIQSTESREKCSIKRSKHDDEAFTVPLWTLWLCQTKIIFYQVIDFFYCYSLLGFFFEFFPPSSCSLCFGVSIWTYTHTHTQTFLLFFAALRARERERELISLSYFFFYIYTHISDTVSRYTWNIYIWNVTFSVFYMLFLLLSTITQFNHPRNVDCWWILSTLCILPKWRGERLCAAGEKWKQWSMYVATANNKIFLV